MSKKHVSPSSKRGALYSVIQSIIIERVRCLPRYRMAIELLELNVPDLQRMLFMLNFLPSLLIAASSHT